jgi:hypothetical protein
MSTTQMKQNISQASREKGKIKPVCVLDYNKHMSRVDLKDQFFVTYLICMWKWYNEGVL